MSIYDKSSLVLIPSGTKTGKVFSQKPVSGDGDFTFTRSSAATRVNADGNIEKETQNLFSGSGDLANTLYWPHSNIQSATGGQAGYDGTSNAVKIVESTGTGQHIIQQSALSPNVVQTISIYAKASGRDWLLINQSGVYKVFYNLSTGSLGNVDSNVIDATITSVGGDWYRCTYTANITYTGARIGMAQSNGTDSYTGDGVSGILIQDAQLEQGLVARDYIETTSPVEGGITDNVPRLDYTDSSCPALLLEPQRTNLFTNSEYTGGYGNFGSTDTPNNASSPEGVQNAVLVEGDGTQPQVFFNTPNVTLSSAGSYTISAFAKKGTSNYMQISLDGFTGAGNGAGYFDLENGTTPTSGASIEDYGNDWYRCILVVTIDAGDLFGRIAIRVTPSTSGFLWSSSSEANGKNIYMYGFQMEAGSYETSYIPTYGSSVTRVADVDCETANPNTSLFGQTEGTIFCEYTPVSDDTTNQSRFIRLRNSSNSNQIYMQHNALNNINAVVFNGSNQFVGQTSTGYASVGNTYKFALAYKDGDYAFYANGVQIDTGTATGLGTLAVDRLDLDNVNISKSSKVNQALVFKTRLSNEELAALTTI